LRSEPLYSDYTLPVKSQLADEPSVNEVIPLSVVDAAEYDYEKTMAHRKSESWIDWRKTSLVVSA